MATTNISLPETLKEFVDTQVQTLSLESPSKFAYAMWKYFHTKDEASRNCYA